MERRVLGNTGEELSILGLGGIVINNMPQEESNRIVAEAVDRGVTYFDVAPDYDDAQERLGPALRPYRENAFLACKTERWDADGCARELDESLRLLRTDHVDLYQFHGLNSHDDVEEVLGPGGAIETFEAARRDGKVRYFGFSSHTVEGAELALARYDGWDSILLPVNFVCWREGFGPQLLDAAKDRGVARLALKSIARTNWPDREHPKYSKCWYEPFDDPDQAGLAFRFTLSQDVTAAVTPGDPALFPMMLDLADQFRPITAEELARLHRLTEGLTPIFPEDG